ncbi:hypothetical protein RUM43_011932 [Polyplax serrata]|uniref:Uncharacterized protein n=1 Tax=Polyplax serrata TaxID=468196 RepID=A0AAN8S7H0_POLSC
MRFFLYYTGICARLDVHQTIPLTTSTEASKLLSAVWQYTLSLSETELIIKDTGQLMYCHLSPLSKMSPKIAQDDFVELELDPVMKTGKVVLVGSTGVGKTTLLQRFLDDKSNLKVQPTIWPSIFCIRLPVFGEILSLEVWDTSGQEKYRTIAHFFFGGIDVALVVFDITKTATFTQAKTWASEILHFCKNPPILLLIGNKKDLTRRRQVSKIDALMYADKIGAAYMECSSTSHKGEETNLAEPSST